MGQTLSEPITAKESASCGNEQYKVGSSCMQGWRINMEDAHTHLLALPDDHKTAFFAVYDGHGGAKVSQYAGMHLHKKIVTEANYKRGNIVDAIQSGFLALDEQMKADAETKDEVSGTTAVIVLIRDQQIYCGNVGDSRAVASICGRAEALSFDHKPANEGEAQRIVAAGGWVEFNRVNGNLALSRALGDFVFKGNTSKSAEEQVVTAYPDVTTSEVTKDHEFIILACDGIWDVMSNQEVVDFCRDRLARGWEPEVICEDLLDRCLAPDCQMGGLGCDNMTAVLVCLMQNESNEEFAARCARLAAAPVPDNTENGTGDEEDQIINQVVEKANLVVGVPGTVTVHESGDEQFLTPQPSPNDYDVKQEFGDQIAEADATDEDDAQPPTHFNVPDSDSS
ncbi:hypothetical protein QR680_013191 [Steinernema hermaphroditum]|uniref:protein-serine/threonine phosphatase n=1 Tax=Steinernema hermaphroditum TaxID=289476 RepID=A0AA39I4N6_9BILA|nr:hypothetical protein QR680_013191 [Steinernema hermaphroditum]